MYLALTYDLVDDYLQRRGEFRDEHLALARAARDRVEFALDPYVVNGLVTGWRIREWNVAVGGD